LALSLIEGMMLVVIDVWRSIKLPKM